MRCQLLQISKQLYHQRIPTCWKSTSRISTRTVKRHATTRPIYPLSCSRDHTSSWRNETSQVWKEEEIHIQQVTETIFSVNWVERARSRSMLLPVCCVSMWSTCRLTTTIHWLQVWRLKKEGREMTSCGSFVCLPQSVEIRTLKQQQQELSWSGRVVLFFFCVWQN